MSIGRILGVYPEPQVIARLNTRQREKARLSFMLFDVSVQVLAVALSYVISQQLVGWVEPWYQSWRRRRSFAAKGTSGGADGLSMTEERLRRLDLNECVN
jgi:hypothetical protein